MFLDAPPPWVEGRFFLKNFGIKCFGSGTHLWHTFPCFVTAACDILWHSWDVRDPRNFRGCQGRALMELMHATSHPTFCTFSHFSLHFLKAWKASSRLSNALSVQVANFQVFFRCLREIIPAAKPALRTIYCLNWKVSGRITYSLYVLFLEVLTLGVKVWDIFWGKSFQSCVHFISKARNGKRLENSKVHWFLLDDAGSRLLWWRKSQQWFR